jgi:hypothetical protein
MLSAGFFYFRDEAFVTSVLLCREWLPVSAAFFLVPEAFFAAGAACRPALVSEFPDRRLA